MKTRIKGLLILCTVLCMGFILSACGGVSNTENATAKKTVLNESIDIKDIDYDVDTGVIKGRKCLSFNYTNNSKYTINKVQLKLIQKDDADLKKTKEIFSDYISFADFSDERLKEFYIMAINDSPTDAGQRAENGKCLINNSWWSQQIKQYKYLRPYEMTIEYVDSDKNTKTITYDYDTKEYIKHVD